MEQAIKKAIQEGGYGKRNYRWNDDTIEERNLPFLEKEEILLDPLFWQALGKAEGWEKDGSDTYFSNWTSWQYYWHRFIDHLAEGKSADSFFEELLSRLNK